MCKRQKKNKKKKNIIIIMPESHSTKGNTRLARMQIIGTEFYRRLAELYIILGGSAYLFSAATPSS